MANMLRTNLWGLKTRKLTISQSDEDSSGLTILLGLLVPMLGSLCKAKEITRTIIHNSVVWSPSRLYQCTISTGPSLYFFTRNFLVMSEFAKSIHTPDKKHIILQGPPEKNNFFIPDGKPAMDYGKKNLLGKSNWKLTMSESDDERSGLASLIDSPVLRPVLRLGPPCRAQQLLWTIMDCERTLPMYTFLWLRPLLIKTSRNKRAQSMTPLCSPKYRCVQCVFSCPRPNVVAKIDCLFLKGPSLLLWRREHSEIEFSCMHQSWKDRMCWGSCCHNLSPLNRDNYEWCFP